MARYAVAAVVLSGVLAAGVACSGSDGDANGSVCPDGFTRSESTSDATGPGAATREEAVRAPGESAGTEELVVENDQGVEVTMLLAPLDPVWAVQRSTWCEAI